MMIVREEVINLIMMTTMSMVLLSLACVCVCCVCCVCLSECVSVLAGVSRLAYTRFRQA